MCVLKSLLIFDCWCYLFCKNYDWMITRLAYRKSAPLYNSFIKFIYCILNFCLQWTIDNKEWTLNNTTKLFHENKVIKTNKYLCNINSLFSNILFTFKHALYKLKRVYFLSKRKKKIIIFLKKFWFKNQLYLTLLVRFFEKKII